MSAMTRAWAAVGCRVNVTITRWRDGRVVGVDRVHNLAVTTGFNLIRDLLGGVGGNAISHFALGNSSTAVNVAQTALVGETYRDTLTSRVTSVAAKLTCNYYLGTTLGNGLTLREAGLFNASSSGTMYARVVLPTAIVKTSSQSVTFTWDLTWTNA